MKQIIQHNKRPHAVSHEKDRAMRLLNRDPSQKRSQVFPILGPGIDVPALPARAPVPALVETIYRVAARHEGVNNVHIAPAVLSVAMNDCENGARVALGTPALAVEPGAA